MNKVLVAITGASGAPYARSILDKLVTLKDQYKEVSVVMSRNAATVWETETGDDTYKNYPFPVFKNDDFSAPFASGSGQYNVMIVAPCSMGTLGRIATGISNDLVTRAADVVLKERRKLICLVRETPFNLVHIRNMETVTLAGGIICPASPSFYSVPKSIDELVSTVTDRVLDLAGFDISTFRWGS